MDNIYFVINVASKLLSDPLGKKDFFVKGRVKKESKKKTGKDESGASAVETCKIPDFQSNVSQNYSRSASL